MAGRIYGKVEDQFVEQTSLRIRNLNLNCMHGCNDLVCSPNNDCLIATNSAVVVGSLGKGGLVKTETGLLGAQEDRQQG